MSKGMRKYGTAYAAWQVAQKLGNGAIVKFLTGGRPYCDGGQAVKSSKGYGAESDAHGIAAKNPQFVG